MKLPANLRIISGVRQDHRGRRYRIGVYPSGKSVVVPYEDTDAPPARMIPVVAEPERVSARHSSGRVLEPQLAYVEWRDRGKSSLFIDFWPNAAAAQRFVDAELRPLMISPDQGKTWQVLANGPVDYFAQYHKEASETE